ncbi:MAG: zinc ribbon domain-containing protein [Anaerolineae bacterium]|nr:zinc ribbon domain-containing protein [Anaerolineae bacterium]
MKCVQCGFENRTGARFCKRCGIALESPMPVVSSSSVVVCQNCGATLKPGARFCSRCGQPVPTASDAASVSPAVSYPTPSVQPSPPESVPAGYPPLPEFATPDWSSVSAAEDYGFPPGGGTVGGAPSMPGEGLSSGVSSNSSSGVMYAPAPDLPTARQAYSPPPAKSGIPVWVWGVGSVLLVVIAVVVVFMIFNPFGNLGSGLEGGTETPSATETVLPTATIAAAPVESFTSIPTQTPLPTPTPKLDTLLADAQIAMSIAQNPVRVGERLTVTIVITNTEEVDIGDLTVVLTDVGGPYLRLEGNDALSRADPIAPQSSYTETFVLIADTVGEGILNTSITFEVRSDPVKPDWAKQGPLRVKVESP